MTQSAEIQNELKRTSTKAFSSFEWMLAWRYLMPNRKGFLFSSITGFSLLGIMVGVATLIIVMAVMNGFRTELLDRILGVNGHVIVHPIGSPFRNYDEIAANVEKVDGVRHAHPIIEGQTLVDGLTNNKLFALVRGLKEKDLKLILNKPENIKKGTLDDFAATEGVAIGNWMAHNLGLQLGDDITITAPDGDVTAFGVTPRVKSYPVTAIFEVGHYDFDNSFIFMPLEEAQLYFNKEHIVDFIEIFIDDPDQVDQYYEQIAESIERQHWLQDWRQKNESTVAALKIERNVMFMILVLIILVASLNIVSGLIMMVKDKSHDIAILRTMGVTSGAIMRVFILTGTTMGIIGTTLGVIIGVLFCNNIKAIQDFLSWLKGEPVWDSTVRFIADVPAEMDSSETVMVVVMAITLSFLATLYPAWRAAKLDPVEALRYE